MTAAGNRRTGPRIRLRGSSAGFKTSTPDDIYEELLEEALRNSREEGNRPLKRRKSGRDRQEVIVADESIQEGIEQPTLGNEREAVVITSSSNPSESDGEIEWDDVDLTALSKVEGQESKSSPVIREIALKSPSQNPTPKRMSMIPRNAFMKRIRLEAHRMYLLCLLASFRHLNVLLSSQSILRILRSYVPPANVNGLNAGPEYTQSRRTMAFLSSLKDLASAWSESWIESRRGWRRPRWVDSEDLGKIPAYLDLNESICLNSLEEAARTRSGSRDVGAWLFTALLRSAGVQTRLVCSLQLLQFGFLNEGPRQEFHGDETSPQLEEPSLGVINTSESHISISLTGASTPPSSSRKIGVRPSFPSSSRQGKNVYSNPTQFIAQTKTWSPNHPFFWSEAWDVASQKWISIDAMVGVRVNQPNRMEPPITAANWESGAAGDNILSYVVGFDNGGFAKDVTRRYAKAYYSKTYRHRIESQGSEKWWTRVMRFLDRIEPLDRDQLEEVDLANHVLKEPIPKKIDDFRHHPLYVLKRHLKRNEFLPPSAVHVSAITSGKRTNMKTEYVYKRKDVLSCFSSREWFRHGRIVKQGEQPVKHLNRAVRLVEPSSGEEDVTSIALYTEAQTELYIPPPVENGVVVKNAYGNIDIYTQSMIPAGGTHVVKPSINLAAQFAGIDYADAVTGFEFSRRKANPKFNGIVVASENVEGLLAVWEGMMERVLQEEERIRKQAVFERWRRFFIGMGIRRRLDETHGKVAQPDERMDVEGAVYTDGRSSETSQQSGDMNVFPALGSQPLVDTNSVPDQLISADLIPAHNSSRPANFGQNEVSQIVQIEMSIERARTSGYSFLKDPVVEVEAQKGFFSENDQIRNHSAELEDSSNEDGGFIYDEEDGVL